MLPKTITTTDQYIGLRVISQKLSSSLPCFWFLNLETIKLSYVPYGASEAWNETSQKRVFFASFGTYEE